MKQPMRILLAALLYLLVFPGMTALQAQEGSAGLDRMIRQIEQKFPFLEGYVVEVQGSQLILDLKLGQDVKPGDFLMVIRFGEEIIHPVTKKKLARRETDLGRAEVVEVRKDYSIARLENPGITVKKGDGVRSFFRKISILVAPVRAKKNTRIDTAALGLEIETSLNEHPRFKVPTFDLRVWGRERNVNFSEIPGPEDLLDLQKKVDVDYLLLPQASGMGSQAVLDYQLVSAIDGTVLAQSRLLTEAPKKSDRKAQARGSGTGTKSGPSARGVQTEFSGGDKGEGGPLEFINKQEFMFEIIDMDVGDVNGDGKPDYVIVTPERVRFYRYANQQFKQVAVFRPLDEGSRFLSVDVADINGNGLDEVFVTASMGTRLKSFVIELEKGKKRFTTLDEGLNVYFRALKSPGSKPRLLAQEPGHDRPFRPAIYEYEWKGGDYEEKSEIELPHIPGRPLITVYGLTLANITPTKTLETIFLDSNYHLRVYSASGRLLIKSDEYYGHDPRVIDVALKEQIPGMHNPDDDVQAVPYRGRVSVTQVRDKRYLLVPHNHRLGGSFIDRLTVVNNSSLVVLGVDREGVHKLFETRKQSGYLAAYQVAPSQNPEKKLVHTAHVTQEGQLGLGKKMSTIYTYGW